MSRNIFPVFLLTATIVIFSSVGIAQKPDAIAPPPGTASLADIQKWLTDSITKYGSYKTRVQSVTVSSAKFDGCKFSFVSTRKNGSISSATMGTTRTTTTIKDDVAIDLGSFSPDGVTLTDHIYPELGTIELRSELKQGAIVTEIVVKRVAGDAIKTALIRAISLCSPKH